jgi:hypothetical protein
VTRALKLGSVLILVALAAACGRSATPSPSVSPTSPAVNITITGLPQDMTADLYIDEPAPGGGYIRKSSLGRMVSGTVHAPVGTVIEAAPIPMKGRGGELYEPTDRFQPVPRAGGSLIFTYVRKFLVTVGSWSHGPGVFGQVAGDTSMQTSWVPAGSTISITALPATGWVLAHWGVFPAGQVTDQTTVSSTANPLMLRIDGPVTVMAGFLPAQ